jgi:23S rRNA (cytosine1962-C5)-methyltransferase
VTAQIREATGAGRLIVRLSRRMAGASDLSDGQALWGDAPQRPVLFRENGLQFEADVVAGQKTGHFLDQRDNRALVRGLSRGRRVLDVFACTGAFSVYAAAGGAKAVTAIDSSAPALETAWRNWRLNVPEAIGPSVSFETIAADAFGTLTALRREGRRFDLVVLDPPAFAKRQTEVEGALGAYRRLTRLGLGVLQSGGVLVAASCSSRVPAEAFFDAVHAAAQEAGRPIRAFERTGHALDHPVTFPEGAYLKCIFGNA